MTSQSASAHNQDSGSFLAGFGVGLIAGAVGYFMFATDRGENVRKSLVEEWHNATDKVKQSANKDATQQTVTTVKSLLQDWWKKVEDELETVSESAEKVVKDTTKKAKKKVAEAKKKTPNKFKGV